MNRTEFLNRPDEIQEESGFAVPSTRATKPPAPSATLTAEPADEVFPPGLGESIALLQQVERDRENSKTKAERIANNARLKRIQKHVWNLQQMPKAPVITADDLVARPSSRENRILDRMRAGLNKAAGK